jgi:hypothetical protein
MGHDDSQRSQHSAGTHGSMRRHSTLLIALVAVVFVGAVWGGTVLLTRGVTSPSAVLGAVVPGAEIVAGTALPSATDGQGAYAVWNAETEQDGTTATLYMATIPTPMAGSVLARLLLSPKLLTIGVAVDPSQTIQQVRVLSPRTVVGAPGTLSSFLDGYTGMSFFQVLTAAEGFVPVGGGALASPIGTIVRDLATSAYLRDMGREGFDRLMAQVNSPGLRLDFPFPYFAATTWDGTPFALGQLVGKKVLVTFTEPSCGSCLEATMTLLNTVIMRKFDVTPVVFVFGDPQLEPVQRFMKDAPAGAILISDPERDLARSVNQTLAPYAVILDEQHIIRYSGASDQGSPVYQYLEQLAGAQ